MTIISLWPPLKKFNGHVYFLRSKSRSRTVSFIYCRTIKRVLNNVFIIILLPYLRPFINSFIAIKCVLSFEKTSSLISCLIEKENWNKTNICALRSLQKHCDLLIIIIHSFKNCTGAYSFLRKRRPFLGVISFYNLTTLENYKKKTNTNVL